MKRYLEQASHNENFHICLVEKFKDHFFDWKITVLFYTAIHYLKALAINRGAKIGETHYDIEQSVNPDRDYAVMKISRNACREYKSLFQYSKTARYEGFTDFNTFQKLKQIDYSYCMQHLDNFKKYIKGQGIKID